MNFINIKKILPLCIPVALGYITLGITFGILFQELGYSWYWTSLISIFVYAGAAQFMAIILIKTSAPLSDFFLVTLLLNLRHIFYGLSFIKRYANLGLSKCYLIFSLTDETYSLITTLPKPAEEHRKSFYLSLSCINHLYWILGSFIGGIFGELITIKMVGLDFALTALFVILAIEQFQDKKNIKLVLCSIVIATIFLFAIPKQMLSLSISVCGLILIYLGNKEQWKIK